MMPDPRRLSAVSRSPLVLAGSRWLSFARGLSRGRGRRLAAADTLGFIESLYGGRFASVEGGAFPLDKVYRTAGGGLFVSETRLSVSVHPRFDLRLLNVLNVAGARQGSQAFKESAATTTPLLSHPGVSGREQRRDARHVTNSSVNAPSLTVQTWNVWPSGVGRVPPAFGYVTVRGRHAQPPQGPETARPAVRVERMVRGESLTGTGAGTARPTATPAPASLRLTSLDLRHFVTHATGQEFVNVLLDTYLPTLVSREVSNVRTTRELSGAPAGAATARGATEWRFAPAPFAQRRRPAAWTYAEPARRHTLLQVLPPASLLLSLSETSLTALAGGAGGAVHNTDRLSGRAPELLLQHLRTHTAPSGTRESAAAVDAPRPPGRTPQPQPTLTPDVLSSLHTFVERVHTNVAAVTRGGGSAFFTRAGFEQVTARRRAAASESAPGHATPHKLLGRPVEFIRRAPAAERTRDTSTRTQPAQTPGVFPTQGARTFLFSKTLLRRSERGSAPGVLSPTAATALRPAAAAETERAVRETRAARPEGMALELIRHRREEVLQLPRPGYVFTQPARAQLEERQVITKASREEIVEVVRKEVRSLAAAAPAGPAPARADLAGLADEVYSTLVRRLLVEKERLGRF
jgi:hypothetical protein